MDEKYLTLPALPDEQNDDKTWQFDHLIAEQAIGSIRPDLVATIDDEIMFIEVAVTLSSIDANKSAFIKQLGIKTIEIDLKSLNRIWSCQALKRKTTF